MKYLIDTCVISELCRKQPSKKVTNWLQAQADADLYVSTVTLGEIQRGIFRLPAGSKRSTLEKWFFDELIPRFEGHTVSFDSYSALTWGKLFAAAENEGRTLPLFDSLLGATAIAHQLVLVTRNVRDFNSTSVQVINPWD